MPSMPLSDCVAEEEMDNYEKSIENKKKDRTIAKYLSILQWLPKYTKLAAISDLIAGISLGLTIIPQSIAYAALAGLTAQYGLYSSFVGLFVYILFGTIKEVSIGPTFLMALLTTEFTRDMPVDFIVLLCFLAGCVELLMGLLNLGFLVDFISVPVTSGFTSATSFIVIASQLQGLLGMKFKSYGFIDNIVKLFQNADTARFPDAMLGISSVVFLLFFRKLKDLNCSGISCIGTGSRGKIVKKSLWFLSIGRNALVVLIASIFAFHLHTAGQTRLILSGKVRPGFPEIHLPPFSSQVGNQTYTFFEMCSHLGPGILIVPLIAVLANVAIAKAFASGRVINASQEMRTLGLCNILGSFVSSMPTCGAFTRSAVSRASGIQTPMAGLYSGIMTLLALSFLTPYFFYIPRASLSAVLIAAILFLIDWKIVMVLWKGSKRDAFVLLSTFILCLVFSVETGLILGIILNVILMLYLSARPTIEVRKCTTSLGAPYILVKPDIGFYYPAVAFMSTKVEEAAENQGRGIFPIVVDCERFTGIDYTAVKSIEALLKDFEKKRQELLFLNVSPAVVNTITNLSGVKTFRFVKDEESIANLLCGEITEINRSATVPIFNQTDETIDLFKKGDSAFKSEEIN